MDAAPEPASPSLADLRRVNAACERFEDAWRAGDRPRVEDAVAGWTGPARDALLRELVGLEVELRTSAGETPDPADYLDRFPADARAVWAAFAAAPAGSDPEPASTVAWPSRRPIDTPAPGVAAQVGAYELLDELARGGMGVVYRARQRGLNRPVALKMILSGQFASDQERQRFKLEAELAANLDHPSIVPIYEVGEHEGRLFFSMKLVDGGNLGREVHRLVEDPRAAARLVATVARAVHYAHTRGFLHCDLKPANILLDADGLPHVTDFGLARRVEGESALTVSGALMGTPSYMAPEQASGCRRELTPAADVYGLGAILYELLTGRPPFHAPTMMETVVQVLEREPQPPGQVRPGVPKALEAVCLKCLEKSPRERFASAAELADRLEQFLRGDDLAGSTPWQRLRRWTRREPELVARLGGLALVAGLTQYNYYVTPDPKFRVHYTVQGLIALWAVASVLYQWLLRRGSFPGLVRYAWAATDVLALTALLMALDAFESNLVVGYPLLIAASGLWFRAGLVWFTTGLALIAYGGLYLEASARLPDYMPHQYPDIFLAALAVTGFVVHRQVKRTLALSTYYESR